MATAIEKQVQKINSDTDSLNRQADDLLLQIVSEGRKPSIQERSFFRRAMDWNEQAVLRELERAEAVLSQRMAAGTATDRQAAADECERAAKAFDEKAPQITEQIEALQRQLQSLERSKNLSAKRVQQYHDAVQRLRGVIPSWLESELAAQHVDAAQSLRVPILELETRIGNREWLCDRKSDYSESEQWFQYLAKNFPDCVRKSAMPRTNGKIIRLELNDSIYDGYRMQWLDELDAMRAELAERRAEYARVCAEIDSQRDFYLT